MSAGRIVARPAGAVRNLLTRIAAVTTLVLNVTGVSADAG